MRNVVLPHRMLLAVLIAVPACAADMDAIRAGNYADASKPLSTATLLNWNVDRGGHLEQIRAAFRVHKPDICLLQEVDLHARRTQGKDIAEELAKGLGFNFAFGIEFEEMSQEMGDEPAYHGQATLSDLKILNSRILRFSHQSGFWKPRPLLLSGLPLLQRRLGGRIALISELDNRGAPLVVYNLHLESRGTEHGRLRQLEEVLADAARYPAGVPVIIAGDLNTKARHSPLIARLKEAGYASCLGDRRERTHLIIGALDWVFARGPLEFQSGAVHRENHGSDHYPVVARLKLPAPVRGH